MFTSLFTALTFWINLSGSIPVSPLPQTSHILAQHEMSLNDRQPNKWVDSIFKDNILLNMSYMEGKINNPTRIDWQKVEEPFHYEFTLAPNQTFAFHNDVLNQYQGKVSQTTNAHFNSQEGFKSDGYLVGDGVCHLASLINWAAKDAGLSTLAPTNHNFAVIPDVPREYGVAIYDNPNTKSENAKENLYITNNHSSSVTFKFDYDGDKLKVSVTD